MENLERDWYSDQEILERAAQMLVDAGMISRRQVPSILQGDNCRRLTSDGSTRRFWRLMQGKSTICILVAPQKKSAAELAEAKATWCIGRHLRRHGVPVPEPYGFDAETGAVLFADLGDTRLYDHLHPYEGSVVDSQIVLQYYRQVLQILAEMQLAGGHGFDPAWCWDTPYYDVPLMLERESGYFLRAFWQGLLGRTEETGVVDEFKAIAGIAGKAGNRYFLHRDFQSRNIMVQQNVIGIIDYQGGRLGPLGYDVASLLIDPYAALSLTEQEGLRDYYGSLLVLQDKKGYEDFREFYKYLAIQRNLQIIGAFAFLWQVRGKTFFRSFLVPALCSLRERLAEPNFAEYKILQRMVEQGLTAMRGIVGTEPKIS